MTDCDCEPCKRRAAIADLANKVGDMVFEAQKEWQFTHEELDELMTRLKSEYNWGKMMGVARNAIAEFIPKTTSDAYR